jgi:hypothetical protein
MRTLRPLRLVPGVGELVVATLERERRLGQQADQHFAGLLESVAALTPGAQFDAVRTGFLLVPSGADAHLEPARGDDVQGGDHVGQHRRVAVVDPGDHGAHAQARRGLGQRCQHHPAFEARAPGVAVDRVEVVEVPTRLEDLDLVGGPPHLEHVGPGGALVGCLERESHRLLP